MNELFTGNTFSLQSSQKLRYSGERTKEKIVLAMNVIVLCVPFYRVSIENYTLHIIFNPFRWAYNIHKEKKRLLMKLMLFNK